MKFSPEMYTLHDYQRAFSQPFPRYGSEGLDGWRTHYGTLNLELIARHLNHKNPIASLGRQYTQHAVLDFDDMPLGEVQEILSELGLNQQNSLICTSPSAQSWHVYYKPRYKGEPCTLNLYMLITKAMRDYYRVEVYPQSNRMLRLPFGKGQYILDAQGQPLVHLSWQQSLQRCEELQEFDLMEFNTLFNAKSKHFKTNQYRFLSQQEEEDWFVHQLDQITHNQALMSQDIKAYYGWRQAGEEYLAYGLQAPRTRLEATKRVAYLFWFNNIVLEEAQVLLNEWIATWHNGFSQDWLKRPKYVCEQNAQILQWIYSEFHRKKVYPSTTHTHHDGFLHPSQLETVIRAAKGHLPKMNFFTSLIAYLNPRHTGHNKIAVHHKLLIRWASRSTYLDYLEELESCGMIKRDHRYAIRNYAKGIKLLLPRTSYPESIKLQEDQERSCTTFTNAVSNSYTPQEYSKYLQSLAIDRRTINMQLNILYDSPAAILSSKVANTQASILTYAKNNPTATQKEIAKDLGISDRTIRNDENRISKAEVTKNRIKEYTLAHPNATQKEIAKALDIGLRTVERYRKKQK